MAVDSLRDGFVKLCFDTSLNVGADSACRLVIEGRYIPGGSCPVTPDTLILVNPRTIDCQFGAGSPLAEALKVAISCCAGSNVEIYALPREDNTAHVKAIHRWNFGGGTADSDGVMDFFSGDGRYNFSVEVTEGQSTSTIAANVMAAIPSDFPFTAVAGPTATSLDITFKVGGVIGNTLNTKINWTGAAGRMPEGIGFSESNSTVTAGSGDLVPLNYADVLGECCVCCFALLEPTTPMRENLDAYLKSSWACDTPQCFGHGYTYISSSLGTILANDMNSEVLSIYAALATGEPVFPWLTVAAYAAQSCCLTSNNPEISVQGPEFGVLGCLSQPKSCNSTWTYDERIQLQDAGFVVSVPVSGGQGQLTSPMIVNDITNNRFDATGRQNYTFRDASSRRLAAATATAIAQKLQEFNGLGFYTDGTAIRAGTRGTTTRMMLGQLRAWAKDNIGVLFSQFDDLSKDLTLVDDFTVAAKCAGTPGKLHLNLTYRPPVRITKVQVNAQPKLLSNC